MGVLNLDISNFWATVTIGTKIIKMIIGDQSLMLGDKIKIFAYSL